MKPLVLFCLGFASGATLAVGQSTSTSASFSLLHASAGDLNGGGPVANAVGTVTGEISVGDPTSGLVSNVTGGGVQTKGNFIGQLTDQVSFTITAASPTVNEGESLQFSAKQVLDDSTFFAVADSIVTWGTAVPFASLSASGLASAGAVFENTAASVQGSLGSVSGTHTVTVLNVNPDNFRNYGSDGLDDDWQVFHFGQPPNPKAAPTADADGDGLNNRFEFLSGFTPTDSASAFQFTIHGFSTPGVIEMRLNKVIPGRTYTVKANSDLLTPPSTVGTPFSVTNDELNRVFQDNAATGPRKFYYLEISKP